MIFSPFKSEHKDHKIFKKKSEEEEILKFNGEIRWVRANLPHHNRWSMEVLALMDGDSVSISVD